MQVRLLYIFFTGGTSVMLSCLLLPHMTKTHKFTGRNSARKTWSKVKSANVENQALSDPASFPLLFILFHLL